MESNKLQKSLNNWAIQYPSKVWDEQRLFSKHVQKAKTRIGKSIDQISLERELNKNTIFGHLASFISSGKVLITDLISEAHYNELKRIIPKHSFDNISDLKHKLDEKYSYGELRLVLDEFNKE